MSDSKQTKNQKYTQEAISLIKELIDEERHELLNIDVMAKHVVKYAEELFEWFKGNEVDFDDTDGEYEYMISSTVYKISEFIVFVGEKAQDHEDRYDYLGDFYGSTVGFLKKIYKPKKNSSS